jgi:hypothetical protein
MSDESWDEQFKRFLRKTGEDFRRTGAEITAEAQKLAEAAMDPEKQQKVRDRLGELGDWARKTAQGVAGAVEDAAGKAETAFHRATDKMSGAKSKAQPVAASSRPSRKPAPAARKAKRAKVAKPKKKGAAARRKR